MENASGTAGVVEIQIADVRVPAGRRRLRDVGDLAASVQEVGLLAPVVVTPEMQLVAGHHRLEACRSLGWTTIPARIVRVDDLRRELIEIDENVVRFELTVLERARALAQRRRIYHALHPEVRPVRERGGPGRGKTTASVAAVSPFAEEAATRTGLSQRTVWRLVRLSDDLDHEAADLLDGHAIANSTLDLVRLSRMDRGVQREVARVLAKGTATLKDAMRQLRWRRIPQRGGAPLRGEHYRLHTGDFAAEMGKIAERSAGLVIADLPWSQNFAGRLPELVEQCARLLRPGGHALIIVGQAHLPAVFAAAAERLRYKWTLCLRVPKPKQNWRGSALSVWIPVVVFDRAGAERTYDFRWDVLEDNESGEGREPWAKGQRVLRELVDWFSIPGDKVVDPFCGSGTAGVAALGLGRLFEGIDIDPSAARLAASKLAATTWADPQLAPTAAGRAAYPV